MKKKILLFGLACLIVGSAFYSIEVKDAERPASSKTLVLYDAVSGRIPDSSLMGFTAFPPEGASMSYTDGATLFDTTVTSTDTYAGWVSNAATIAAFPVLDRASGVQLNFSLQLESETHATNHRAGFNVILLDKDSRGIELAFWQNEIWTQNDGSTGGLFTHGEGVAFATTNLTGYQLTINADSYSLAANNIPILTGPIRDYSSFEGFIDPYETPNFLFLGDNTTSAQARVRLYFISVTGTEPIVTMTSTSTALPLPTASLTPPPSATPVPSSSPTPVGRAVELCPFGWFLVAAMIGNTWILRRRR